MRTPRTAFQILLCAASAIAFGILGILGESLLNIFSLFWHGEWRDLPAPTEFALQCFLLNRGNFLLSMTPFMISMIGLPLIYRNRLKGAAFWCWFSAVLIVAIAYFLLFATALTLPFHVLAAGIGDSPVPNIVYIVDFLLVVGMISSVFLISKKRHER